MVGLELVFSSVQGVFDFKEGTSYDACILAVKFCDSGKKNR